MPRHRQKYCFHQSRSLRPCTEYKLRCTSRTGTVLCTWSHPCRPSLGVYQCSPTQQFQPEKVSMHEFRQLIHSQAIAFIHEESHSLVALSYCGPFRESSHRAIPSRHQQAPRPLGLRPLPRLSQQETLGQVPLLGDRKILKS